MWVSSEVENLRSNCCSETRGFTAILFHPLVSSVVIVILGPSTHSISALCMTIILRYMVNLGGSGFTNFNAASPLPYLRVSYAMLLVLI